MASVGLIDATGSKNFFENRTLQPRRKWHDLLLTAADSQHNTHFVSVVAGGLPNPSIVEHIPCNHQGHQLSDVGNFQDIWRKAELHRVKVNVGNETTASAIGLVGALLVGRVVVINVPARKRNIHDGVELCGNVVPVLL